MEHAAGQANQFKWPISASKTIKAPAQDVWATISTHGNLANCHPFVAKSSVEIWPGVGAKDTAHYYSGWVIHREITNWLEGVGYDLIVLKQGGGKTFVSWRITEETQDLSTLNITLYPDTLANIPITIRWIPHFLFLRPMLKNYLESVVKGFEWFITTGTPVTKNQFGSHPWFSN